VLVAGGSYNGVRYDTAEIYDPTSGVFTPTPNRMSTARESAAATKLNDGRVLIAGGFNGNSIKTAELYDPATRMFSALTMTTARNVPTVTLLQDGTVLIAGGFTDGAPTARSAEIFDPATLTFTPTVGDMIAWRGWATATLLADGRVLIAGGQSGDVVSSAEIYDPVTKRFTATGSMSVPRQQHTATALADGSVLIAGGLAEPGVSNYTLPHATMERWVPALNGFVRAGGMEARRASHTAVLLPGDKVFLDGGFTHSWMTAVTGELYQASATPALTTTQVPDGQKDTPYVPTTLTASGGAGGPFAIDLIAGALPPGMSYDGPSRTLSGTPTAPGVYTLGMRVRDAAGQTNFQSLTLRINALNITSPYRLPDAPFGQPYSVQLAPASATWSLPQQSFLPPGLSLSSAGVIAGTATAFGYYNFAVRATDGSGQSTLKVLSIFVFSPPPGDNDASPAQGGPR